MAGSFVGSANTGYNGSGSITIPAATAAGDIILAVVGSTGTTNVTSVGPGFSLLTSYTVSGNPHMFVYYKIATAADGGTTSAWTFSARSTIQLAVYRGVELDAIGSIVIGASGTVSPTAISLTNTGIFVTAAVASTNSTGQFTPNSGFTERTDNGNAGAAAAVEIADLIPASAGDSGVLTITSSTSTSTPLAVVIALREPLATTITDGGSAGIAISTTTSSTLAISTSTAFNPGDVAVLIVAKDNVATTTGSSTNEVISVVDTTSNAWTKVGEYCYSPTSIAGDGGVVAVYFSNITSSLPATSTVTITFSSSIFAKAATLEKFSTPNNLSLVATKYNDSVSLTQLPTETITRSDLGGSGAGEYLYIRAIAAESNKSITASNGFTSFASAQAGSGVTGVSANGEFDVHAISASTSLSDDVSSNPIQASSGSNDAASIYFALKFAITHQGAASLTGTATVTAAGVDITPIGATGNVIKASHYNAMAGVTGTAAASSAAATQVAGYLWGVGYGDRGYGQTSPSLTTKGDEAIRSIHWTDLRTTISNLASWQNTSASNLPAAGTFATSAVAWAPFIPTQLVLSDVDTYRLNYQVGNMTLTSGAASSTRSTSWGSNTTPAITCTFQVIFASENAARYFFNTGGDIRIALAHSNMSTTQNANWNAILSNLVAQFTANTTNRLTGSTGTPQAIGYYQLTTAFQTIYDGTNTGTGAYSVNDYLIEARATTITGLNGAKGSTLEFRVTLTDQHTGTSDSVASGTSATLSHLRASGIASPIASPSCSTSVGF